MEYMYRTDATGDRNVEKVWFKMESTCRGDAVSRRYGNLLSFL